MKQANYMDTIRRAKRIIRFGSVLYVCAIILFTIFLNNSFDYQQLSTFEIVSYISVSLILIILVVLLFLKEITGAILSILFIAVYNISSMIFTNVRELNIQMNLFFVFGATMLFLYFFEKGIQSEKVDYQILMSRYEQLRFNEQITKEMAKITPEMLMNDNLDELLQNILEKAVDLLPKAQSGSILIRNENRMEFRASVGYDLESLKKIKLNFEDMYQYKLGILNEPAVIKDIKTFNKKNLNEKTTKEMEDENALVAKSVLTCSFILKDTIYGFINLDNLEDMEAFNDQDKIHIKHFASQIEIALNNHLLIEEIYSLSRYDALTGVNSRKYHEKLVRELMIESKEKNIPFSIIVMDVNFLKKINDTYGHHVGDQYLIHYTKTIKKNIREHDIFSRTGGDEFVLVMPKTNLEQGMKRMKAIRESLKEEPLVYDSVEHIVEFGCGIANYPIDGEDLTELMAIADQRMYEDKRNSKSFRD